MPGSDALALCTLAWRDTTGYVALATRDPSVGKKEPGYWRDRTFRWPADRDKVDAFLRNAERGRLDVYWSPAVYGSPSRKAAGIVSKIHTLWSDLDDVDPKFLPRHLKPTAAWESSPGRYQGLWVLDKPLTAEQQTKLNQRLTYAIGADKGGWDLTQVLRVPGTHNHKYPNAPEVRLLWSDGRSVRTRQFEADLPEMNGHHKQDELPDPQEVLASYHLPPRAKELIKARVATVGQRSDRLWELECLLAERGMTREEIVSITRRTVWNKFKDRRDEVARLFAEADKAIAHVVPAEPVEPLTLEDEPDEDIEPITWGQFDQHHQPIRWLVADIWGESEVGFISGLPKSYKSWVAIDLAVSVASGSRFLDTFQTRKHNVMLIQEEDPRPVLQDRLVKVGAAKGLVDVTVTGRTTFDMTYDLPNNLYIISNQGFTLDEEWLDRLEDWVLERDIKFLILDPLMMIASGNFDEFKAFEFMTKVLKPLKRLRARTQAAICLVHHHIKGSASGGARDMYGSVALWAWEEAALHLQVSGVGRVTAERFSKHALLPPITLEVGDVSEKWSPTLTMGAMGPGSTVYEVLVTMEGGATAEELQAYMGVGRDSINRQLRKLADEGKVEKAGSDTTGPGRPRVRWKALV